MGTLEWPGLGLGPELGVKLELRFGEGLVVSFRSPPAADFESVGGLLPDSHRDLR